MKLYGWPGPTDGAPTDYAEVGKTARQLSAERTEVDGETIKRKVNGLTTEDQDARAANLTEAMGRLN